MLTVYGIETRITYVSSLRVYSVATVLTVYGIETAIYSLALLKLPSIVATVLTVYGIETVWMFSQGILADELQQCLPFTVLKLSDKNLFNFFYFLVSCNSAYRLRY